MDWGKRVVGMAVGKPCLDEKLAEEDYDFFELGVCLVRWKRYRSKVNCETYMPEGYDDFRDDELGLVVRDYRVFTGPPVVIT